MENAGGFINFTLSEEYLTANLKTILQTKDDFGKSEIGANQKVLVEYFQPNMAKPLHLGHLRTAIIGDSLFKLLKFTGFNVESDTHLGDWGTQFGLLLLAYKKWGDLSVIEKDPITELNKLYVKINSEIEANPELREEGKQEFVKLEQGDEEVKKIWQQFRDWSWQEYSIIYDDLGVRKSDNDWPESFFADKMQDVLDRLKTAGLLQESQGAQIVDLEDHKLGVAVLVKSDSGTTYLLRDLATYIYRKQQGFEKQIYVVDNRQSHTLNQTFKILELLGVIESPSEAIHIAYGFLSLPEGAMSTRKGTIIGANELIQKAQEQALAIIEEKNPGLEDKASAAKVVMQGAIKYFDLSHNYKSDIVFTWDKALSFEGNTGPYLQYTHARINGILRKAGIRDSQEFEIKNISVEDSAVLRKLNQFPEVVEMTAQNYTPNLLCNYLFELSQDFNTFYEASPILKEEDKNIQSFRLHLIMATAQVLKNGLGLLGIQAPEQM
ncbi:arginine--tRNA ligase [bacterium]|nr:MAG: arginine--tRNA ligase [bacterium]